MKAKAFAMTGAMKRRAEIRLSRSLCRPSYRKSSMRPWNLPFTTIWWKSQSFELLPTPWYPSFPLSRAQRCFQPKFPCKTCITFTKAPILIWGTRRARAFSSCKGTFISDISKKMRDNQFVSTGFDGDCRYLPNVWHDKPLPWQNKGVVLLDCELFRMRSIDLQCSGKKNTNVYFKSKNYTYENIDKLSEYEEKFHHRFRSKCYWCIFQTKEKSGGYSVYYYYSRWASIERAICF